MRTFFEGQMELLQVELIKMGSLCEKAIAASASLLEEENGKIRQAAFAADEKIDQKEREIEELCMKILLQQQPVAGDLRKVSAAMKMISDMERIGDQAADIAELSPYLSSSAFDNKKHLRQMAMEAVGMVTDSVEAFVRMDQELAKEVIKKDETVDNIFLQVKEELVEFIRTSGENAASALDILMAAKYLERIADHAVNIAEWVEYCISGIRENNEHRYIQEEKADE